MNSYNSIYSLFTAPPTILTRMTIRKQLITFAAIGALNTAIDIAIYTLLIWLTALLLFGRHHFNHRRNGL